MIVCGMLATPGGGAGKRITLEELAEHGAQPHRADRLVQQMVTAFLCFV
jgi:hypothetical protein